MAFSTVQYYVVYWHTLHGLSVPMLPNFPCHIIDNIHGISVYSTWNYLCEIHRIPLRPLPLVAGERTTNDLGTESIQVWRTKGRFRGEDVD